MTLKPAGIVQSNLLLGQAIIHGVSIKAGGNMSFDRDANGTAKANLKNFLAKLGLDLDEICLAIPQVNGSSNIALVKKQGNNGRIILTPDSPEIASLSLMPGNKGIDACLSASSKLFMAILHADCAPVMIFDLYNHYAGIIHVGVLGALNGITSSALNYLQKWCSIDPKFLLCYIGPCICPDCYDVTTSVHWPEIKKHLTAKQSSNFDLKQTIMDQLITAGVREKNIDVSQFCTCHDEHLFFSNHRAKTLAEKQNEGRNMAIIGLK